MCKILVPTTEICKTRYSRHVLRPSIHIVLPTKRGGHNNLATTLWQNTEKLSVVTPDKNLKVLKRIPNRTDLKMYVFCPILATTCKPLARNVITSTLLWTLWTGGNRALPTKTTLDLAQLAIVVICLYRSP